MAIARPALATVCLLLSTCAPEASPRAHVVYPAPSSPASGAPSEVETGEAPPVEAPELVPTAPVRGPFAFANIDPIDDFVVGPPEARASCAADLAAASIEFQPATLIVRRKNAMVCGAPQVIVYRGSPAKISYSPRPTVTCALALSLARFETIIQEEAMSTFGQRVVKVHQIGTYACRGMASDRTWVSEHAYANAIDITDFVLADGRTIDVLRDFKPRVARSSKKESAFLRRIANRAFDEETFSSVLTPFFDHHHVGHFHLDLARFRSDGSRMMGGLPAFSGAIAPAAGS